MENTSLSSTETPRTDNNSRDRQIGRKRQYVKESFFITQQSEVNYDNVTVNCKRKRKARNKNPQCNC